MSPSLGLLESEPEKHAHLHVLASSAMALYCTNYILPSPAAATNTTTSMYSTILLHMLSLSYFSPPPPSSFVDGRVELREREKKREGLSDEKLREGGKREEERNISSVVR
jgi:hypothetical protein